MIEKQTLKKLLQMHIGLILLSDSIQILSIFDLDEDYVDFMKSRIGKEEVWEKFI